MWGKMSDGNQTWLCIENSNKWKIWEDISLIKKEEEFLEQVKGKRIRWTAWSKDTWFIASDLTSDGKEMLGTNNTGARCRHRTENGFVSAGNHWEFFTDQPKRKLWLWDVQDGLSGNIIKCLSYIDESGNGSNGKCLFVTSSLIKKHENEFIEI